MLAAKQLSKASRELLNTYLPLACGDWALDLDHYTVRLEASQRLFDFLVKIDYTLGRTGWGYPPHMLQEKVDSLRSIIGPVPPNWSALAVIDRVWWLRVRALDVLAEVDARMAHGASLGLGSKKPWSGVYDSDYLARVMQDLSQDFSGGAFLLLGSFNQDAVVPGDVDLRIVVPALDRLAYLGAVERMQHYRTLRPYPVTYMLLPQDLGGAFMAADPAESFSQGGRLLAGDISYRPWMLRHPIDLKLVNLCMRIHRVLTLDHLDPPPTPVQRFLVNIPHYAHTELQTFFGPRGIETIKYREEDLPTRPWIEWVRLCHREMNTILELFEAPLRELIRDAEAG